MLSRFKFRKWLMFQAWLEVRESMTIFVARTYMTLFVLAITYFVRLLTKWLMMDDWTGKALIILESIAMLLEFTAFCVFSLMDLITLLNKSRREGH